MHCSCKDLIYGNLLRWLKYTIQAELGLDKFQCAYTEFLKAEIYGLFYQAFIKPILMVEIATASA